MKPVHSLLLGLYGGLWRLAAPLLRRNGRLGEGFEDRLAPQGWPFAPPVARSAAPPVAPLLIPSCVPPCIPQDAGAPATLLRLWIQAASGGEAWLVHSLVPEILRAVAAHAARGGGSARPPHVQILCTTLTRQGLEVLEKFTPPSRAGLSSLTILPRYCPLDRPDLMRRAFRLFPPAAVILLETELWPGLLSAARAAGTPVLVLNGRMTEKSLSAYRLIASFWRPLAPQTILAVSPADGRRFSALFGPASRVGTMPNIKFDRVTESLEQPEPGLASDAAFPRAVAGCPEHALLTALASVREEEEDMLLPALAGLRTRDVGGAPLVLAVAPRHMHRVEAWKEKLGASGIPFRLRSSGTGPGSSAPFPVWLWDSFGELHALYDIADAVFVGGSLAPLGGQNFLEPLARGLRPRVGPHVGNFLWVGEDVFSSGLAVRIAGPEALADALLAALREQRAALPAGCGATEDAWRTARAKAAAAVRERFALWLAPRAGGSALAARALLDALYSAPDSASLS